MPKKKKPYLPFEEAKKYIREQCIQSRSTYDTWWKANTPKTIPRFPYRVYTSEWKGWNDFLGNANTFDAGKKSFRPLNEAIIWVHKLGIKSQAEWLKYCSENRSSMPADIPSRPEIVYPDWTSWNHWLGNKPQQKAEAQVAAQSNTIYYLIREVGYAQNVLTIGVLQGGRSALKDRWEREKFDVIKMFRYRPEMQGTINVIIEQLSTPFYGNKYVRVVPNVHQLLYSLSTIMDVVT